MVKVKIHVEYCGGWGYAPKYRRLATALLEEFDEDQLDIVGEATPQITGYLEVSVNGQLVHSKKNGDGYIDNDAKLQKITDAVAAALKA